MRGRIHFGISTLLILSSKISIEIRTKRGKVDLSPKMLGMDWHIILYNACHVYVASYHFIIRAHQQARLSCDQFWYLCVDMYICKTFKLSYLKLLREPSSQKITTSSVVYSKFQASGRLWSFNYNTNTIYAI